MVRINKTKKGFTLVEVVLVIAIILILASATALGIKDILNNANEASVSASDAISSEKANNSMWESKLAGKGF